MNTCKRLIITQLAIGTVSQIMSPANGVKLSLNISKNTKPVSSAGRAVFYRQLLPTGETSTAPMGQNPEKITIGGRISAQSVGNALGRGLVFCVLQAQSLVGLDKSSERLGTIGMTLGRFEQGDFQRANQDFDVVGGRDVRRRERLASLQTAG